MIKLNTKNRHTIRRSISLAILLVFVVHMGFSPISPAFGQTALPLPGTMVNLSPSYAPALIKGLRVYPDNPLRFDFIVDAGDSGLQGEDFKQESSKLIKYFLSSLTIPDKDLWVNLSPHEKDRIVPDAFGKTEMGRDLLAQDYVLKQLSASIIYPESKIGQSFWAQVYRKANEVLGSGDEAIKTFNKIWIVPEKAVVFAKDQTAYVVESHLKVMLAEEMTRTLEGGRWTLEKNNSTNDQRPASSLQTHQPPASSLQSNIFRTTILPLIEKEVNEGENFAPLRQVYNSLMLAVWFKRNLRNNILGKIYVGQNKTDGVTFDDKTDKERIYSQYLEAFQKGVYNYIKEEKVAATDEVIPRKYFSGGVSAFETEKVLEETRDGSRVAGSPLTASAAVVAVELGKPGASSTLLADNPDAVALSERFSVRDNYRFGPKAVVATMDVNLTPSKKYRLTKDVNTTDQTSRDDAIAAFRAAFVANDSDPMVSLKAIRPLVEYVRTTYSQKSSDRIRNVIGDELADNFEYLGQMFEGRADFNITYAQNLLAKTLDVIRRLPDEAIGQIIDAARKNSERFIQVTYGGLENLDNFKIALTVNADDVFRFRDEGSGRYVLEIDLLSFLGDYFTRSIQLAWRHYTPTDLSREQLREKVLQFAQQRKNDFIQSNVEVVEEVLRIMQYMQNGDNYFGIGRYLYTDRSEQQAAFLADIAADERNRQLVKLIRQLGDLYIEEQQGEKTVRLPDTQRRVEAILRFVLNKTRLAKRAAIQGDYTQADVQAIAELSTELFISGTKEFPKTGDTQAPSAAANQTRVVTREPKVEESFGVTQAVATGDTNFFVDQISRHPVGWALGAGIFIVGALATVGLNFETVDQGNNSRPEATNGEQVVIIDTYPGSGRSLSVGGQATKSRNSPNLQENTLYVIRQHEGSLLEQLGKDPGEFVPSTILADGEDGIHPNPLSPGNVKNRQQQSQVKVIVITIPYQQNDQMYLGKINPGVKEMEGARTSAQKTRAFLETVWPNFLIMRANDWQSAKVDDVVLRAIAMIGDSQLRTAFADLLKYSKDPKQNQDKIAQIDNLIRNSKFLTDQGIYAHVEVISRTRVRADKSENVFLLSMIAFNIDEIMNQKIEGVDTSVRVLGQDISRLNVNFSALGFTYLGDGHSVVLRRSVEEMMRLNVFPYLNNALLMNASDAQKPVHPMYQSMRELLVKEHPASPTSEQKKGIYAKAVRSVARHEAGHLADHQNQTQARFTGLEQRVAQETMQYLDSIADQDSRGTPNMPLTDLVLIGQQYMDLRTDYGVLADAQGVYFQAFENVLLLLADNFGIPMTAESLSERPRENINNILVRAGQLGSIAVKNRAKEISIRVKQKQREGQDYMPENRMVSDDAGDLNFQLIDPKRGNIITGIPREQYNLFYVVRKQDTLSQLSADFGLSPFRGPVQIANANSWAAWGRIDSIDKISVGQSLLIPGVRLELAQVQAGDTLSSLAYRYYGDASLWRRIASFNRITSDGALRLPVGQEVQIPMNGREYDQFQKKETIQSASVSSASSQVGGISLETMDTQMQMQGEEIKFNVPPIDPLLLKNLQSEPVNGFVPVILDITPINAQTLPIFLGQVPKEPAKEPELAALTES